MQLASDLVQAWIKPGANVLDLGCGDGTLLEQLVREKNVTGYGVEINHDALTRCVAKGLNVIEQNMDEGLSNFQDNSFDTVVMTQALQAVHFPHLVMDEMLRIGKECVVSFPNFGHLRSRLHLVTNGRMPVSKFLPYQWYDTPNIHFCTVKDFEDLCAEKGITILNRSIVNGANIETALTRALPNLLGVTAIYRITR